MQVQAGWIEEHRCQQPREEVNEENLEDNQILGRSAGGNEEEGTNCSDFKDLVRYRQTDREEVQSPLP